MSTTGEGGKWGKDFVKPLSTVVTLRPRKWTRGRVSTTFCGIYGLWARASRSRYLVT